MSELEFEPSKTIELMIKTTCRDGRPLIESSQCTKKNNKYLEHITCDDIRTQSS